MAEPRFGFQISWIARMLRTRFDARTRATGLTRPQWSAIATIALAEGCTQSELASKLELNTVTIGGIIDRLEAAGLVERRTDPGDRRANRVHLRATAAPLLKQLSNVGRDEERTALEGFDEAEQAQLLDMLERVIVNLVRAPRPESLAAVGEQRTG